MTTVYPEHCYSYVSTILGVLVRLSIARKRHHDQGNTYRGQLLIGTALQNQRFSQGRKYGSVQADIVLEKELRGLHLDLEGNKEKTVLTDSEGRGGSQSQPPQLTHFLQQGQIYSTTKTHLLIVPSPGPSIIKQSNPAIEMCCTIGDTFGTPVFGAPFSTEQWFLRPKRSDYCFISCPEET